MHVHKDTVRKLPEKYRIAGYFIFRESTANPRKLKLWKIINVEEARFSISICEITLREQGIELAVREI